jgi:hypothetical protein
MRACVPAHRQAVTASVLTAFGARRALAVNCGAQNRAATGLITERSARCECPASTERRLDL